jgi:hypothetical protein
MSSKNVKALLRSTDPADRRVVDALQKKFINQRLLTPGQVFVSKTLSNVSVQYKNEDYIGDQLMPVVDVDQVAGTYFKYGKSDRLTSYDDSIGPNGTPNEISETRSTDTYACTPHALVNYLDNETMRQQDAPLDEMTDLSEAVMDNLLLNKEIRKAAILTTAGSYDAANVQTLSGTSQWNSTAGDPVNVLLRATSSLWMGNAPSDIVGWCGLDVWNVLRAHPAILDLFKYGGGNGPALATEAMIASFFGWSKLLVGKARRQTANEGQTAVYGRVWGKHMGVVRVARKPGKRAASFGYDFRVSGDPKTDTWFDPKRGMSGSYACRTGFNEGLKVVANDTGALIVDAVS